MNEYGVTETFVTADNLKHIVREFIRMTPADEKYIAKQIGVIENSVSRWKCGDRSPDVCRFIDLAKLADAKLFLIKEDIRLRLCNENIGRFVSNMVATNPNKSMLAIRSHVHRETLMRWVNHPDIITRTSTLKVLRVVEASRWKVVASY